MPIRQEYVRLVSHSIRSRPACKLRHVLLQVYAVDWSPDGGAVASGGKDRVIKIWKN